MLQSVPLITGEKRTKCTLLLTSKAWLQEILAKPANTGLCGYVKGTCTNSGSVTSLSYALHVQKHIPADVSGKQPHQGGSKGNKVCKDALGSTGKKKDAMFKRKVRS